MNTQTRHGAVIHTCTSHGAVMRTRASHELLDTRTSCSDGFMHTLGEWWCQEGVSQVACHDVRKRRLAAEASKVVWWWVYAQGTLVTDPRKELMLIKIITFPTHFGPNQRSPACVCVSVCDYVWEYLRVCMSVSVCVTVCQCVCMSMSVEWDQQTTPKSRGGS